MPKSKSKRTVRAASSGATPKHPALNSMHPAIAVRLHKSEEGYRLPDEFSEPTAVSVLYDNYSVSSDANGVCCFAEYPFLYRQNAAPGPPLAGGTLANTRQCSAFLSIADRARVLSIKIQIEYVGADLSAAGYLSYVRRRDSALITGTSSVDVFHQLADKQTAAKNGMHVTGSFHSEPTMEVPNNTTFMADKHHTHIFAASALPVSTQVFRVRVTRYVEFIPKEADLSEGATRVEPHDPAAYSVHNTLGALSSSVSTMAGWAGHVADIARMANDAYHTVQPLVPYVASAARSNLATALTGGVMLLGA